MDEKNQLLYFDHAATTPVRKNVLEEIIRAAQMDYNPAALYSGGRNAEERMYQAKKKMADCLNCDVSELIVTSGGTESDNFALKGYAFANQARGKHIIVSAIEHAAVLKSANFLERCGFSVSYLQAEKNGQISPLTLKKEMRPDTILVSVMHVNNETGVIQPLHALAQIAHDGGAAFFSDGVAGACALPLSFHELPVDMYAISAHKLGGPKGVGLLYVKQGTVLEPLLHGGGQEAGMRSGTPAVPLIVGMAAALQEVQKRVRDHLFISHITQLRDRLQAELMETCKNVMVSGIDAPRVPHLCHMIFPGLSGEGIVALLDCHHVAVSAGAACHAGDFTPSHVLLAMGIDVAHARSGVRVSLGEESTEETVKSAISEISSVIRQLYALK